MKLTPASGCIRAAVDDLTGATFDPDAGAHALADAMLTARSFGPDHAAAAYQRARDVHYLDVAQGFAAIVDELLQSAAAASRAHPDFEL